MVYYFEVGFNIEPMPCGRELESLLLCSKAVLQFIVSDFRTYLLRSCVEFGCWDRFVFQRTLGEHTLSGILCFFYLLVHQRTLFFFFDKHVPDHIFLLYCDWLMYDVLVVLPDVPVVFSFEIGYLTFRTMSFQLGPNIYWKRFDGIVAEPTKCLN
jgi:hypothetical protein